MGMKGHPGVAGHNLGGLPAGGKGEGQTAEERGEMDEGRHGKDPNCDFLQPP